VLGDEVIREEPGPSEDRLQKQVVRSFRDLMVWQLSVELSVVVYGVTKSFPKSEIYGLSSQMQRAAVSIASNIAEGQARQHTAEFIPFISIARGSVAELETQSIIAERLGYISPEPAKDLSRRLESISKMLRKLQIALRK
jgi:four helix bundle protein